MKKKKARSAVRKNIYEIFYAWCDENKLNGNAASLVAFDKQFPDYKLLDHEKAQKEGYSIALRQQAAAIIAQWATLVPLKVTSGAVPLPERSAVRQVRVQPVYNLPGRGMVQVNKMDQAALKQLMGMFKAEAENKLARMYIIGKRLERLQEVRKDVRQAFQQAEESAYESVAAA